MSMASALGGVQPASKDVFGMRLSESFGNKDGFPTGVYYKVSDNPEIDSRTRRQKTELHPLTVPPFLSIDQR